MLGALAGCGSSPEPDDGAEPTPSAREPAFPSNEAAFDAAVALYQRYFDVSGAILAEGGVDVDRLYEVAEEGTWAENEIATFRHFAELRQHIEGRATFRNPQLVQYQPDTGLVQIYACTDASQTRVIDATGVDVTPERQPEVPFVVTFTVSGDRQLLIEEAEVWDGAGIC
jgi:hypothetical protein